MIEPQYFKRIEKGSTVSYGNKPYRVQDDRGYLHIIVIENNKRKKISIEAFNENFFEPGTTADYVFNEWWKIYESEEQYRQFTNAEISWLNHK